MDDKGKILLVRNKGMPYYSLPGGHVEDDESTKVAYERELMEELGIVSKHSHLKFIVEMPHINSFECYYVEKVKEIDTRSLTGSHFLEEIDEVICANYIEEENYYPKWLKGYSLEEIFSPEVLYVGVQE